MNKRALLLVATTSYRTDDFVAAARHLGVEPMVGTDRCSKLAEIWSAQAFGTLALDFRDPAHAAAQIAEAAAERPFDAILPTDEPTAVLAAHAAARVGLPGNPVAATERARDKEKMRAALAAAGVPAPAARGFALDTDPAEIAGQVRFPCVVKPLLLSTSRGVIRADDAAGLTAAIGRLAELLGRPRFRAVADPAGRRLLVEDFVPGPEVALEGVLGRGELRVLALFDKPDPLDGPFFEETIYVTPSRHPPEWVRAIEQVTARAAAAMGLREGPIHAELRLSPSGPQVIEVAARSIGGLCARTLRFGLGEASSLEEIVLRQALGMELGPLDRAGAAGVMMVPIPRAGVLKGVDGIEAARAVPLIEDVVVTARPGELVAPAPEGASYLGFIFARAPEPAAAEAALRSAHRCLRIEVTPTL